jgi:hypothetical protein
VALDLSDRHQLPIEPKSTPRRRECNFAGADPRWKASLAVRENTPQRRDQLIEFEQRRRHINLQRLGGLEVDDELQLGREFDRKIGRLLPLQDLVHTPLGAPIHNRKRKKARLELAHHWMQAAVQSESTVVVNYSPPEHGAL